MKAGTENRKKTIIAAALGTVGLICVFYIYTQLFGGSQPPAPAPAPVVDHHPNASDANTNHHRHSAKDRRRPHR